MSEYLGLFWGSRIPSGVPDPIPGYLGLFGGRSTHPGASELILGWLGLFWNARVCFGVPGPHLGDLNLFWGACLSKGLFSRALFSRGATAPQNSWLPSAPPPPFGNGREGGQRPSLGVPAPPSCFGGVRVMPWGVWVCGGRDLGA